MVDFSSLEEVTQQAEGWRPPTPEMLAGPDTYVLGFDQSLRATGYVAMARVDGTICVMFAKTLKTPALSGYSGFEEDYARALAMEDMVAKEIEAGLWLVTNTVIRLRVVHETPPVLNKRTLVRLGANAGIPARMGGQAVRSAAHRHGLDDVSMVNAQQAKKFVCGNAKAEKKEAHDALRTLTWIESLDLALKNENLRDSAMVCLVALFRERS